MSPRFMLDTDTVSFALRGEGRVASRLLQERPSAVCVSSITVAELAFGATRRKSPKLQALIDRFLSSVQVLAFDTAAAMRFGAVAATLAEAGTPIGNLDTLIASHALSCDLTLATNNRKHFGLVPGLRTENWL
jgi:tRNA(fMet)-specific endonuclease VapC